MYHLTTNYLLPKFLDDKLNEEGIFTLVQTIAFDLDSQREDHQDIHKKAIGTNKPRWCAWVSRDYQILRDHKVKRLYCEHCE